MYGKQKQQLCLQTENEQHSVSKMISYMKGELRMLKHLRTAMSYLNCNYIEILN